MSRKFTNDANQFLSYGNPASAAQHILHGKTSLRSGGYFRRDVSTSAQRQITYSHTTSSSGGLQLAVDDNDEILLDIFDIGTTVHLFFTPVVGTWYRFLWDVTYDDGGDGNVTVNMYLKGLDGVVDDSEVFTDTGIVAASFTADAEPIAIGARHGDSQRWQGELEGILFAEGTWSTAEAATSASESPHKMIVDAGEESDILFHAPLEGINGDLADDYAGLTATPSTPPERGIGPAIERSGTPNRFLLFGDTQYYARDTQSTGSWDGNEYDELFTFMSDYESSLGLKAILSTGDLVQDTDDATADPDNEVTRTRAALDNLNSSLPIAFPLGNHDFDDPSSDRDISLISGSSDLPPTLFTTGRTGFTGSVYTGSELDASYVYWFRKIVLGKVHMIFSLPYAPTSGMCAWVKSESAKNPNWTVWIGMHAWLDEDASTPFGTLNSYPGGLSGHGTNTEIWDDYFSLIPNLAVIYGGHAIIDGSSADTRKPVNHRTRTGDSGNVVMELYHNGQFDNHDNTPANGRPNDQEFRRDSLMQFLTFTDATNITVDTYYQHSDYDEFGAMVTDNSATVTQVDGDVAFSFELQPVLSSSLGRSKRGRKFRSYAHPGI